MRSDPNTNSHRLPDPIPLGKNFRFYSGGMPACLSQIHGYNSMSTLFVGTNAKPKDSDALDYIGPSKDIHVKKATLIYDEERNGWAVPGRETIHDRERATIVCQNMSLLMG